MDNETVFENYVIAERLKNNRLRDRDVQTFFWRVKGNGAKEIDYLEESAEKGLVAYEFKWNPAKAAKAKCPKVFQKPIRARGGSAYRARTTSSSRRDGYMMVAVPCFATKRRLCLID